MLRTTHVHRKFKSNWNTSTTVQLGFGQLEILETPVLTKNSPTISNDKVELIFDFTLPVTSVQGTFQWKHNAIHFQHSLRTSQSGLTFCTMVVAWLCWKARRRKSSRITSSNYQQNSISPSAHLPLSPQPNLTPIWIKTTCALATVVTEVIPGKEGLNWD